MALIHTLRDDFSTNTLATNWPNSFGTCTITGGRMRVNCDTAFNGAKTATTYTLTGSKVTAQVFPAALASATTEATTELLVVTTTAGTDAGFSYNALTGNVTMAVRAGFFDGGATTFVYNSTTHRWWRLRESGGSLFFETSPDGDTWTTRRTATTPAWAPNTNLAASLNSHRNNGTNNFAEFDNYNIATVAGTMAAGTTTLTATITGKRNANGVLAAGAGAISPAISGIHRTVKGSLAAPLTVSPNIVGASTAIAYDAPAPRALWQFLTGPRTGGYTQELTAAKARKVTARLTSASEVGFTLDARLPQALTVDEMVTDVHVLWTSKQGVLHRLVRGRVGAITDTGDADKHAMAVTVLDYRAVLDRRRLLEGRALNLNAGFQDGIAFWTGAGGTLEQDTSEAQVGGKSGKITPDGVTATVSITSDDFAATPTADHRVTGWVRCAVAKSVTAKVVWKNAAHALISDDDVVLSLAAGEWTRVELDATSPALTAFASLVVSMTGTPAATDLLHVDELRLSTAPYHQSRLRFEQVDQAEIAWQMIEDTQERLAGGLGISPAWSGSTPTGEPRDRLYELGDSIGERIQQLSELIDGFDWDIRPTSASGLTLEVWHPERGANRGVVLEYGGLVTEFNRQVNPSDYANAIRQTGADDLDAQEREADDLATQLAGRWDGVYADTGLTTQQAVNDRAHWQMKQAQVIQPAWTVKLRPDAWEGPDHIWLGDAVRLIVYSGRLSVDTTLRVFEIAFDIADDGSTAVELTLGAPKPDYRKMPSLFSRRITNLERR